MHCLPCVFSGQSSRSTLSMKVSKWSQLASELNPTMVKFHSKFTQNEHVWKQGRLCFSVWYFLLLFLLTMKTDVHDGDTTSEIVDKTPCQHQQRPLVSLGRYFFFFGCFDKTRGNTVDTLFFYRYRCAGSSRWNCFENSSIPTAIISHSKLVKYMQANIPAIPYCCVMETFYITGYRASSFLHEA